MKLFTQSPGQSGYYHFAITAEGALYDALAMDDFGGHRPE